jgi:SAM-dependent methyltransferase
MYSEHSDFERHDQEVDRFLEFARFHNLSIPTDSLILDVGGDLGMHIWKLLPLCKRVYVTDVIDYSSTLNGQLLHLIAEKHQRNNRPFDLSKVVFIQSDAQDQIFRTNLFDAVISINAFEHIPDPRKALYEIIRVSKKNAVLYFEFDPLWTSPGGGHFQPYVLEPWAHLLWELADYKAKMKSAGAAEKEIDDFPLAMNRQPLSSFRKLFQAVQDQGYFRILALQTWPSGREEEPQSQHPNFQKLLAMGYSEEDLIVRGVRVLAIRTGKSFG